jgi:type I restriction enzyme S subunit
MIDVRPRPIKDYCLGIFDGPHATPGEADDGPIFLGIKNITDDGRLNLSEIRHVSEQEFPRWTKRVTPRSGDVVFTYEATLHRYAIIPEGFRGCLGRRVALVRPDLSKVDSRFLLYYFLSFGWRRVVEGTVINGVTVDRIPLEKFPNLPVRLPGLNVQRSIADVLSTYDDLIANNRRRIELLEQSAHHLFKEWFVHLRYPGHEHDKVVDGVPAGWTRTILSEISDIGRGASPRPINLFMGGTVPWFKIADATAAESPFVFESKEHVSEEGAKRSVFLEPGSLIISNSATCGLPCFTGVGGCIHDGWLYFRDIRRVGQYFLYCFFHSKRNELVSSVSDGSTQKNLNTDAAGRLSLILPPKDLLTREFEVTVKPQFIQISTLAKQNMALQRARNLLLPRLMDGRLSI